MIKNIFGAVAAVAMAVTPAIAKVDAGTPDLLATIAQSDINLQVDSDWCNQNPNVDGVYRFRGFHRQLIICTRGVVDANDHDTVRHEVTHAIQHCINVSRGTPLNSPVNQDVNELVKDARLILGQERLDHIQRSYKREHWLVEIEANLIAELFTAEELQQLFLESCVYTD